MSVEENLSEKGLTLPAAPAPAANYVPYVISDGHLYVSGQISQDADGNLITGRLGETMSIEDGQAAAERCALALIAQAKAACEGDLSKIAQVVRLGGFVNCTPEFTDQPKVINGASDLMVAAFGDAGRHARAAVGAPSLPMGVAVEIDAIFRLA
ncbi:RidA family protein [Paracoccaceae bacterium GXU_MW_L88]